MANTTFSGPVRSENGFIAATKNASTGAFTNVFAISSTGAYTGTKLVAQELQRNRSSNSWYN